jgi:FixJ family two-component response regulator
VQRLGEVVYLVDDDLSIRESMTDLLEAAGLTVVSFESAETFLRHERRDSAGCLLLDLQLPQMNGLELQNRLAARPDLPIIFITAHGDIPASVRAIKGGAQEFLTKPVDRAALMAAIQTAFAANRQARSQQAAMALQRGKLACVTPREREVLTLIVSGYLNKQVAVMLGISEVTVQIHRGRIMRKMEVDSFADLVRVCGLLGIPDPSASHGSPASVEEP